MSERPDLVAFDAVAAGLASRLRALVVALDRLDRLESGSGVWRAGFVEAELPGAAAELVLRALRTAGDPLTSGILAALAAETPQSVGRLMRATGLGRLALAERLNDLVQVGLATRMIDTDQVQLTAAGAALAQLLDMLVAGVRGHYLAQTEQ